MTRLSGDTLVLWLRGWARPRTRIAGVIDTRSIRSFRGHEWRPVFENLEPRLCLTHISVTEAPANVPNIEIQRLEAPASVAGNTNGSVVVWQSYNQDSLLTWGIYGRRLDASGAAIGSEFLINTTYLLDDQQRPSVAMNSSGAFAVAWDGGGLLGLFPGVYVQRFASDGTPTGSAVGVAGSLLLEVSNAAISMDAAGNFVVVYEAVDGLLSRGVFARLYDSAGNALTSAFRVNPDALGEQLAPSVSMRADGTFVVAWQGDGTGDSSGVYARAYNADGSAATGEILLNQTTGSAQSAVAIDALDTGNFVAAWSGNGAGDTQGVFVRRFNSAGTALSTETLVNSYTTNTQAQPSVAFDDDGDFVVTWSGEGADDVDGVYAREFASNGAARGAQFRVNATAAGVQSRASVARRAENSYVMAWGGAGVSDGSGVFVASTANDLPSITLGTPVNTYSEGDSWVTLASGLTLADQDHGSLTEARVRFTANFESGADELSVASAGGLTVVWDGVTGTLTLSGSASLATYQAALRSVRYRSTSENPSTSPRTLRWDVHDGTDRSTASDTTMDVTAINDAPVLGLANISATYTEGDGWLTLDNGLTLGDVDHTSLTQARVSIVAGYESGIDELSVLVGGGLTIAWDGGSGVLTLSGSASVATYLAALRSVRFRNLSEDPSVATRTLRWQAFDGTDWSVQTDQSLAVSRVNDAASITLSIANASYTENDGWMTLDASLSVADVDDTQLTRARIVITSNFEVGVDELNAALPGGLSASWDGVTGTLTLTGAATRAAYRDALRSVRYRNLSEDPIAATRTIEWQVDDGAGWSAADSLSLAVSAVNDAASIALTSGLASYTEGDGWLTLDSGLTIADADDAVLTGARVRLSIGYESGVDELSVASPGTFTINWDSATGTLTLSGSGTLAEYRSALRSVRYRNASDSLSTTNRTLRWDLHDGTAWGTHDDLALSITAVNDAPVLSLGSAAIDYTENQGWLTLDAAFDVSDSDSGTLTDVTITFVAGFEEGSDELDVALPGGLTVLWDGVAGTLTLSGAASVATYQAAMRSVRYRTLSENPSTAQRTVRWRAFDGSDWSVPLDQMFQVHATNDAPSVVLSASVLTYTEGSGWLTLDAGQTVGDVDSALVSEARVVIAGGFDAGIDELNVASAGGLSVSWDNVNGILTLSGNATAAVYQAALRSLRYRTLSDAPAGGTRDIEWSVFDGSLWSATDTLQLSVSAVNDPPTLALVLPLAAYAEDDGWAVLDALLTVGDVDHSTLSEARIVISDGYEAGFDELSVASPGSLSVHWDAPSGTLRLTGTGTLLEYRNALRTLRYRNTSENPSTADREFTWEIGDGSAWSAAQIQSVGFTALNDAPTVAYSIASRTYTEGDGWLTLDAGLLVNDVDSTHLTSAVIRISNGYQSGWDELDVEHPGTLIVTWDSLAGELTISGSGTLAAYQAALRSVRFRNQSENPSIATRDLELEVHDGAIASAVQTLPLVFTAINDAPTLAIGTPTVLYTESDGWLTLDSSIVVLDIDSVTLSSATVAIGSGFELGQDELNAGSPGALSFSWDSVTGVLTLSGSATVAEYQAALRSIRFRNLSDDLSVVSRALAWRVHDGAHWSNVGNTTITVAAVNDIPTLLLTQTLLSYTEGQGILTLDSGLSIDDEDDTVLTQAVIEIIAGYETGVDSLELGNAGGLTIAWDSASGRLTVSGSASLATYQLVLRTVQFRHDSDNPSQIDREISWRVFDGSAWSSIALQTLVLTGVNDLPILGGIPASHAYSEGQGWLTLASLLTITDPDSSQLAAATIEISVGYNSAFDAIDVTDPQGLSVSWNVSTATLTLSGAASVSDYAAALGSVRFRSTQVSGVFMVKTLTWTVSDGQGWSLPQSMGIVPEALNDSPEVVLGTLTHAYTEGNGWTILDPLVSVSDIDSATLTRARIRIQLGYEATVDRMRFADPQGLTVLWHAATGTLELVGAASVSAYLSALRSVEFANESDNPSTANRAVTWQVYDGEMWSNVATQTVTFVAVNDAPTLHPGTLLTDYFENDDWLALSPSLILHDPDNTQLNEATVHLAGGYTTGDDQLTADVNSALVLQWHVASGILRISGLASVNAYRMALRSVRFRTVSENPSEVARFISWSVYDGHVWSAPVLQSLTVWSVNDIPIVHPTAQPLIYSERSGWLTLDSLTDASDLDDHDLFGAEISIAVGYQSVEDQLTAAELHGIAATWNAATGILTLTGQASPQNYREVLRTVQYANHSYAPSTSERSIRWRVFDGDDWSISTSQTLEIASVANPPQLNIVHASIPVLASQQPASLGVSATLSDPDSDGLTDIRITITNSYRSGIDRLSLLGEHPGISVTWDEASGMLVLTGNVSLAAFASAISSLAYSTLTPDATSGHRTLSFAVRDSDGVTTEVQSPLALFVPPVDPSTQPPTQPQDPTQPPDPPEEEPPVDNEPPPQPIIYPPGSGGSNEPPASEPGNPAPGTGDGETPDPPAHVPETPSPPTTRDPDTERPSDQGRTSSTDAEPVVPPAPGDPPVPATPSPDPSGPQPQLPGEPTTLPPVSSEPNLTENGEDARATLSPRQSIAQEVVAAVPKQIVAVAIQMLATPAIALATPTATPLAEDWSAAFEETTGIRTTQAMVVGVVSLTLLSGTYALSTTLLVMSSRSAASAIVELHDKDLLRMLRSWDRQQRFDQIRFIVFLAIRSILR